MGTFVLSEESIVLPLTVLPLNIPRSTRGKIELRVTEVHNGNILDSVIREVLIEVPL